MTDGKDSSVCRFKTRNGGESIIDLGESCDFNSVILKEKGLNVQKFSISVSDDNENFTQIYANDKIEFHRLCTFDTVKARYVKLTVEKSDNLPKSVKWKYIMPFPKRRMIFVFQHTVPWVVPYSESLMTQRCPMLKKTQNQGAYRCRLLRYRNRLY